MKYICYLVVCLFCFESIHAQGIRVYKKDGTVVKYNYVEIDSLVAYDYGEEPLMINGHEAVDLGLSVLWATCNVDASTPEQMGGHYAWGETQTKSSYEWDNFFDRSHSKYNLKGKTQLDPEDDVAHVKWGDLWRMPNREEMEELYTQCIWKQVTQNGVNGYLVTGPNRMSIFLPIAGIYGGEDRSVDALWWSSTLCNENRLAYCVSHDGYYGHGLYDAYGLLYVGGSVRPVYPK